MQATRRTRWARAMQIKCAFTYSCMSMSCVSIFMQALAGIKEDEVGEGGAGGARLGETEAVLALIRLSSLFEKMPVLEPGGKEVSLIADSLKVGFVQRKSFQFQKL